MQITLIITADPDEPYDMQMLRRIERATAMAEVLYKLSTDDSLPRTVHRAVAQYCERCNVDLEEIYS